MMGDGFEHIAWLLPATAEHSEKRQVLYDAIARVPSGVEFMEMFTANAVRDGGPMATRLRA